MSWVDPRAPKKPVPFNMFSAGPPLPAEWTDAINAAALEHTRVEFPKEAIGIVIDGSYEPLTNVSATPEDSIELSDEDMLRAGLASILFHSHPNGLECPSAADMTYQQQLGIPFVVQPWPEGRIFTFGEGLPTAPLIGRAFRHGVHDCYALGRDWYRETYGIELVAMPRDWEWWDKHPEQDLYLAHFQELGFQKIDIAHSTKKGDVLLFNFRFKIAMHAAIVTSKDLILHHISGSKPYDQTRISAEVPRVRWVRLATHALRHRDVA